jgi:CheY-like chemotaxis protein
MSESKESYHEDAKGGDSKGGDEPLTPTEQKAIAYISQTGQIFECNDRFCELLDSTEKELTKQYITDLTKFDNPNILLEAVHELDELFANPISSSTKSFWKALIHPRFLASTIDEEYFIIIHKSKEPRKIRNKTVLEGRLLRASEIAPNPARLSMRKISSSDLNSMRDSPIKPHSTTSSSSAAAGTSSSGHGGYGDGSKGIQRVLIVEDSPTALKMMKYMITKLGHEVTTAVNGIDALDELRSSAFDIVLMDINMPKMNGLEASHEFRKSEEERNKLYGTKKYLKVIAMSGDISNTLFHEVTNAGFDAFIPKPLTEERFLEVLRMPDPSSHHATGLKK